MKIVIKHGKFVNDYKRRFCCRNCGCEFTGDDEDYWFSYEYNTNVASCPECYEISTML